MGGGRGGRGGTGRKKKHVGLDYHSVHTYKGKYLAGKIF